MKSVKMKYLPDGKIKLLPEIVNFDKHKIDIDGYQNGKIASD
jgi:antitoxin component YwqK of YwqJK toxin-antitoxin module